MFKTTLYLDAQTRHALRSLAAHEGRTQTSILRDALARYAQFAGATALDGKLPPGMGAYRSGNPSMAANTRATLRRAVAARGLRRGA